MNGPLCRALAVAGLMLLAGCTGLGLQEAEMTAPQGNSFDRALRDGYLDLSRDEFDEADYRDSDNFAERSIAAAEGGEVLPEEISARDLPDDEVGTLSNARQSLMAALSGGAAQRDPLNAAEAQVAFDCWMQEQEEDIQPDHIAACRDRFMTAMAQLEQQPPPAAPAPPPPPAPMPEPDLGPFTVYFDFDDAELTADARTELADVIEAAESSTTQSVNITGYADLSGAEAYNQVLSERRANSVIEFLVQGGVEASRIVGRGLGESNPVVQTEAPEQRNRRVEIEFQP